MEFVNYNQRTNESVSFSSYAEFGNRLPVLFLKNCKRARRPMVELAHACKKLIYIYNL